MTARDLAYNDLLRQGCHPSALEPLKPTEPSDAVWLLAARFCGDWYGEWEWFAQPSNLLPVKAERYFVGEEGHDAKVLRTWLKYASDRVKKAERRLLVRALIDGLTDGLTAKAPRLLVRLAANDTWTWDGMSFPASTESGSMRAKEG